MIKPKTSQETANWPRRHTWRCCCKENNKTPAEDRKFSWQMQQAKTAGKGSRQRQRKATTATAFAMNCMLQLSVGLSMAIYIRTLGQSQRLRPPLTASNTTPPCFTPVSSYRLQKALPDITGHCWALQDTAGHWWTRGKSNLATHLPTQPTDRLPHIVMLRSYLLVSPPAPLGHNQPQAAMFILRLLYYILYVQKSTIISKKKLNYVVM